MERSIWLDSWYCLDCKRVVMLNAHGRCERCNSTAVVSEHNRREPKANGAERDISSNTTQLPYPFDDCYCRSCDGYRKEAPNEQRTATTYGLLA